MVIRYMPVLLSLERVKNILLRTFNKFVKKSDNSNRLIDIRKTIFYWNLPEFSKTVKEIEALIERDVKLLFIYSGSYNRYGRVCRPFRGNRIEGSIDTKYFEKSNHTFTLKEDREALINAVKKWIYDKAFA